MSPDHLRTSQDRGLEESRPDRGDEANTLVQHLRREIFSEAEPGELSGKFCRQFKGKFFWPNREFESLLVRQLVFCFSEKFRHQKFS